MFQVHLKNASTFKSIIEAIKDLVDEANFNVNSDGIQLRSMDNSHVALCWLTLEASGFDSFSCDCPQSIGFSISSLSKIMKCASKTDEMILEYHDDDFLEISFKGEEDGSSFKLKLIEIDADSLTINDFEFTNVLTLDSTRFKKIVGNLSSFGDTIGVHVQEKSVTFSIDGEIGQGSVTLDTEENEQLSQSFSIGLVEKFTKATGLSKQVVIQLGNGVPALFQYKFEGGHVQYYLAPKYTDSDEEESDEE